MPKRDRIELHRQTAAWLERRIDERPELAVTVADHLDRALSLAEEVAPLGPPDPALLESTVASLMRAGEWARTNAAVPEAITLFERAAEVGGEAPARARLALALAQAGRVDQAIETAEQAAEIDGSAEAKAVAALALAVAARSRANLEQMREHGERARCLASEASLPLVEADAIQLVALPAFWSGATLEAGDLYANAMEVASRVGDVALAAIGTVGAGFTSLVAGDLQAAEHRAEAASRLAVESGSLKTRGYALELVSDLRMVQDRLEESVAHTQEWLRLYAEGGDRVWVVSACTFLGERLQLLGRLDEAWAALEQGLAADAEIGVSAYIVNLRTRRARVLLEWGRVDDAETEVAHVAPERLEILDDWFDWAAAKAEIAGARGQPDEVEALWAEFLRRPPPTLFWGAALRLRFLRLFADLGRPELARAGLADVRVLLEGRGAELYERQARELEAQLGEPVS